MIMVEASSTLVQYVQQTLDPEETAGEGYGLAPIGHVVSVASASPVSIEVKTTVTFEEGHNWSNTKAAIAEAVDAYFLGIKKELVRNITNHCQGIADWNRILGVDGVVDVTGTKLNGTASNMTLTEFCIPKLGVFLHDKREVDLVSYLPPFMQSYKEPVAALEAGKPWI